MTDTTRRWEVVLIDDDGTTTVVATRKTFRGAELQALMLDIGAVLRHLGARPGYSYDTRPGPRPDPAPFSERWRSR